MPPQSSQTVATAAIVTRSVKMTPAPLHVGQAPSELALNSAGFTLGLANAVRIGSSSPVYSPGCCAASLDRVWSTATTPSFLGIEPWISELLPEPATR